MERLRSFCERMRRKFRGYPHDAAWAVDVCATVAAIRHARSAPLPLVLIGGSGDHTRYFGISHEEGG